VVVVVVVMMMEVERGCRRDTMDARTY
jgi:hypothetical protein